MGQITNLHSLPATSTVQSFSTLPAINSIAPILPPPNDNGSAGLVSNHVSSHFSTGLLSGAVEKHRSTKPRKQSHVSGASVSPTYSVSHDDPTVLMAATAAGSTLEANGLAAATNAALAHNGGVMPTGLPGDHHHGAVPPTAVYEADGIQFKVLEQLPDMKIQRLRSEKIKPIEALTFSDIKAYNRNQLRAYCSVYGIRRKKKADMERDMARYAALFHPNDPDYDLSKFEPTEYADGPIPRRKVPVTKEQKEKAAGDFKQLTNAMHQRPSYSPGLRGSHRYAGPPPPTTPVGHVSAAGGDVPNGNPQQQHHVQQQHAHAAHYNSVHAHAQHAPPPPQHHHHAHAPQHGHHGPPPPPQHHAHYHQPPPHHHHQPQHHAQPSVSHHDHLQRAHAMNGHHHHHHHQHHDGGGGPGMQLDQSGGAGMGSPGRLADVQQHMSAPDQSADSHQAAAAAAAAAAHQSVVAASHGEAGAVAVGTAAAGNGTGRADAAVVKEEERMEVVGGGREEGHDGDGVGGTRATGDSTGGDKSNSNSHDSNSNSNNSSGGGKGGATGGDLMSVGEMHVSHQLLSISHPIGEE